MKIQTHINRINAIIKRASADSSIVMNPYLSSFTGLWKKTGVHSGLAFTVLIPYLDNGDKLCWTLTRYNATVRIKGGRNFKYAVKIESIEKDVFQGRADENPREGAARWAFNDALKSNADGLMDNDKIICYF